MSASMKKKYMLSLQQPSGLPKAYQRVEYIESHGTEYIDTGVYFDLDYKLKTRISFNTLGDQTLIGIRLYNEFQAASNYKWELFGINGSNYWQIAYGTQWYNASSPTVVANTIYDIESKLSVGEQYLKANGGSIITQTNSDTQYLDYAKLRKWFIFARSGQNGVGVPNNFFKGKLYSFTLTKNDVVVRDYIPCYRKADSEVGLYDLISKTFYTNQGTGDFTAGVSILDEQAETLYQQVEYIQTTGTQYIDTGYIPTKNTRVEVEFVDNDTSSDTCLCGCRNATNTDTRFIIGTYQDTVLFSYGYPLAVSNRPTITSGTRHSAIMFYGGALFDGVSYQVHLEEIVFTRNIYVGCTNWAGNPNYYSKALFYSFRLRESGNIARDLVPCYRKSDGEIGLYDVVNGVFYTNQGTGEFTCGASMLSASERETYQQVEYIGNQNTSGSTYLSIPKFPYKLQTKYSSTQVTQTDATFLRTYPAVSSEMLTFLGVNSSLQFRINFANYQNYTSPTTSDNTIFDYTIKLDTSIEATLNGTSYTKSYNGVCSAGRSSLEQFENTSMTILANRPTAINNNRYWKLYALRFYDKNYALIGDYVPVYRKSDNEIGLYDLVSKSFYTNEGDGTLAKGNLM